MSYVSGRGKHYRDNIFVCCEIGLLEHQIFVSRHTFSMSRNKVNLYITFDVTTKFSYVATKNCPSSQVIENFYHDITSLCRDIILKREQTLSQFLSLTRHNKHLT